MVDALFLICFFLVVYPYAIYPLLAIGLSRIAGRAWVKEDVWRDVTLLVSVYNEEGVIREKIENALALDYPENRYEIVVVSDGSTDQTNQIVSSFKDPRVVLKAFPERAGKTSCLNRVVPDVRGEIVILTDANSMFPCQTLKNIVRNFADERIGLVTGWTKYRRDDKEETPGLYSRLEKVIKQAESLVSSCVGADGAIFAIRKELYRRLEEADINDFVIPLNVIAQKQRVVLDAEVYCLEEPSEGNAQEFRRQVRITNRTLGAIWRNRGFLNPSTFGSFAFFLISHKVIRFMVPFFFCGMLLTSLCLSLQSGIYFWVFAAIIAFVLTGIAGLLSLGNSKIINLCMLFLLTNAAQMMGWFRFVTGRADTMWTPQR